MCMNFSLIFIGSRLGCVEVDDSWQLALNLIEAMSEEVGDRVKHEGEEDGRLKA